MLSLRQLCKCSLLLDARERGTDQGAGERGELQSLLFPAPRSAAHDLLTAERGTGSPTLGRTRERGESSCCTLSSPLPSLQRPFVPQSKEKEEMQQRISRLERSSRGSSNSVSCGFAFCLVGNALRFAMSSRIMKKK